MWESEKKRQKLKLLWGSVTYRSLWTGLLHTLLSDIFHDDSSTKPIYRLSQVCYFQKQFFFYLLFLHQSNNLLSNVLSNKFLWNVSWPIRFDWITFKYLNFLNWQYMYIVIQSRLCDCKVMVKEYTIWHWM